MPLCLGLACMPPAQPWLGHGLAYYFYHRSRSWANHLSSHRSSQGRLVSGVKGTRCSATHWPSSGRAEQPLCGRLACLPACALSRAEAAFVAVHVLSSALTACCVCPPSLPLLSSGLIPARTARRHAVRLRPDFDRGCYNLGTVCYAYACTLQGEVAMLAKGG